MALKLNNYVIVLVIFMNFNNFVISVVIFIDFAYNKSVIIKHKTPIKM